MANTPASHRPSGLSNRPRVDIRDKVTGRATYLEDLPVPEDTVYAAPLRSPYSHARIVSVDSSRAEQLPGVLGVIHSGKHSDYKVHIEASTADNEFIATDRARFDGDLLGMIVATDERTARRAAELVEVEYEPLPTIFSLEEAVAPGAPQIHDDVDRNLALQDRLEWGDVDAALAQADHVFEASFGSPSIYHHPIEPTMSIVVRATDDSVEIWAPSNNPFDLVDGTSKLFSLDPEQVRVHAPYVGGNFGAKHISRELLVAAALSRKIGRPIKFIADETDSFRSTARHAMDYKARVGVKADGTLVALDVQLDIDTGAYFTGAAIATGNAVTSSWGGYRVPNFRIQARTAYTNKVPAAMFRNTGKNQTAFGVDCAMDHAARQLGIDPIAFRKKNLLKRGETIDAKTWTRRGKEGPAEIPILDTDFDDLIDTALAHSGWDPVASAAEQPGDSRKARGRGIAVSLRRGSSMGAANAMATLEPDGAIAIAHNAPEVGEGAHTMISVVAAKAAGVSQDLVRIGEVDTANRLFFSGTSSQRTTVQMGTAVRKACEALREEIQEAAAQRYGGAPDDWATTDDGTVRRGSEQHSLADLAAGLTPGTTLRGIGSYDRSAVRDVSFGNHDYWSPGLAVAEVEVDRDTGEVKVLGYTAIADAGTILHYHSAKGQIEGGAVMGFGASLTEETRYEEGQLINGDAFQYRLPLMSDIPEEFNTVLLEHGDGPGPFGSKGIAQTSIPCVAPAICNAIYDAVGVRLSSIPFTPESLLRKMQES